jgi:hypothetical protein
VWIFWLVGLGMGRKCEDGGAMRASKGVIYGGLRWLLGSVFRDPVL